MTIKEMINVMQAYADGKEIEHCLKSEHIWRTIKFPMWDWNYHDYRIKPEPKYVPYDDVSEVDKDKWIVAKTHSMMCRIVAINHFDGSVYLSAGGWKKLDILFRDYVYEDGSPCGKLVEA